MGVFHIYKIVQIIPNHATYRKCIVRNVSDYKLIRTSIIYFVTNPQPIHETEQMIEMRCEYLFVYRFNRVYL